VLFRSGPSARIADYRVSTGWAVDRSGGQRWVALRSFTSDGARRLLLVDPQTLITRAAPAGEFEVRPVKWAALRGALAETPYGRAIGRPIGGGPVLGDETRSNQAGAERPGISLTVDLCPSRHPLDRELFVELVREMSPAERPVPVAIAVTGYWMQVHGEDLAWLIDQARSGALAITWINHSYNHRVDPAAPPSRNFLLEPGTDVRGEVLATERALLKHGLTPSVFFRFPGLVSSPRLDATIADFGLIVVGSDAWLAKGQAPRPGSIVLVHGNGNEPLGVRRFLALLRTERGAVREGRWTLLDLRQALDARPAEKR
jgi:hypothetical protein